MNERIKFFVSKYSENLAKRFFLFVLLSVKCSGRKSNKRMTDRTSTDEFSHRSLESFKSFVSNIIWELWFQMSWVLAQICCWFRIDSLNSKIISREKLGNDRTFENKIHDTIYVCHAIFYVWDTQALDFPIWLQRFQSFISYFIFMFFFLVCFLFHDHNFSFLFSCSFNDAICFIFRMRSLDPTNSQQIRFLCLFVS